MHEKKETGETDYSKPKVTAGGFTLAEGAVEEAADGDVVVEATAATGGCSGGAGSRGLRCLRGGRAGTSIARLARSCRLMFTLAMSFIYGIDDNTVRCVRVVG